MSKFIGLMTVRDEGDIIAQTLHHLLTWIDELHVFDLGSTDDTWKIVADYAGRDKRVIPFRHQPIIYQDFLRSFMFHQLRGRFRSDDWILKIDGDEFYEIAPPEFVRTRLRPWEAMVYLQWYFFCLTDRDVAAWKAGQETIVDRARPIQDRRRFYKILDYSEPRMFKYRPSMKWPAMNNWPFFGGIVATERIPIRHYPHRDPLQMARRFRLRSAMKSIGGSAGGHWNLEDWQQEIVAVGAACAGTAIKKDGARQMETVLDSPLLQWHPGEPLPAAARRSHLAPLPARLAKRLIYPLVPLLERSKPGFDPAYQPRIIPEEITRQLMEADRGQVEIGARMRGTLPEPVDVLTLDPFPKSFAAQRLPATDASKIRPRVVVIQDGARLHYALPVALKRAGLLTALYTNWYNDGSPMARWMIQLAQLFYPAEADRMRQRYCADLAEKKIFDAKISCLFTSLLCVCIGWQNRLTQSMVGFHRRRWRGRGPLAGGRGGLDMVFAFTHLATPESVKQWQGYGWRVMLDQPSAPMAEWIRQAQRNEALWPGWETPFPTDGMSKWGDMEMASLRLADHITCASQYVRDGLLADKIAPEKITVVPYPLDLGAFPLVDRSGRNSLVNVGFCGQVGLRKGAPWFLEVAQRCAGKNIHFTMVGGTALLPGALAKLRQHVELVGAVPRSQVLAWLNQFDIFLFPSTTEGSAGAVMEAMATGLPIVTTPNSGTVVRDGVDGYIIPHDQPELMAQRVMELAVDEQKRLAMGRASRERAAEFSIDFYRREISRVIYQVIYQVLGPPPP